MATRRKDNPEDYLSSTVRMWFVIVRDLGFPVFVAGYLLWKITGILESINTTLAVQGEVLRSLMKMMDTVFKGMS